MTEIAELTARLDIAGLTEFSRGLAQADASVDVLRKNLQGLTADAVAARAALSGMADALGAARALSGNIGATDASLAKNRANLALLEKERDVLAEIKALSGVAGSVAGGGVSVSGASVGSLTSNRYGLLGAMLGPQTAQALAGQLRTKAQQDASVGGLDGALLGAAAAQGGGGVPGYVSPADRSAAAAAANLLAATRGAASGGTGFGYNPWEIKAAAAAAAAAAGGPETAAGASGGGGGGGLLTALGFGAAASGGHRIPWWIGGRFLGGTALGAGLAGFGTIGSLAGFGAEHVLTSGIGIGGSLLGGLAGGGLAAGGVLGTAAVGLGTDLAGIGQAGGDIKNVTQGLTALQTAIKTYGVNSQQAAIAQAQLNTTLSSFSPVARQAVLAASQTAEGFKAMFDRVTGQAEKIGAQIINQAMQTGEAFLPTIGKFAAQNLGIIQADLQPFFSWLKNASPSGGLGIFTQLEKSFQAQLPAGVSALTNGLELFIKTIGVASSQTSGFVGRINNFLTNANTTGFSAWSAEVVRLIGLFKTWVGTFGALGHVIVDIFRPAVGFGEGFANMLTGIFKQIDGWLKQPSTQQLLHGLFSVDFAEVIKGLGGIVLALLPPLENATADFIKMSIVVRNLVNDVLLPFADILKSIGKLPFVDWLAGWVISLLLVKGAITGVITISRTLLGTLGLVDAEIVTAGTSSAVASGEVLGLKGSLLSLGSTSVLGAIGAAGAALLALYQLKQALQSRGSVQAAQKAGDIGLFGTAASGAVVGGTPSSPKYAAVGTHITYQGHTGIVTNFGGSLFLVPTGPQPNLGGVAGESPQSIAAQARAAAAARRAAGAAAAAGTTTNPFGSGLYGNLPTSFLNALNYGQAFPGQNNATEKTAIQNAIAWLASHYRTAGKQQQPDLQAIANLKDLLAALASPTSSTLTTATPNGGSVPSIWQLPAANAGALARTALAAALLRPGAVKQEIAATQAALKVAAAAAASFPANSQNQLAAIAEETTLAQQLASLKGTGASTSGVSFLTAGTRARLAAAQNATAGITAGTAPTLTTIRAQVGLLTQLNAAVKQLTTAINGGTYAGKQLTAAQAEQTTLIKARAAAVLALANSRGNLAAERILGIAGSGSQTGATAARSATASVRSFLNDTLKQFGLAQTGSSPLGPFVRELYKMGDINKRQYESLEKILASINDVKKINGTVASGITGNISQRLAEVKQELGAQTGFMLTGAQHALSGILRGSGARLTGSAAARARFLEQGQYALAHNGMVLTNAGAALGVPLTRSGAPSRIHLTVEVKGNTRIDKENAQAIANALRRKTGRNSVQMTGSNAGVNLGW